MSGFMSERWPNLTAVVVGTQSATISLPALYARKRSRIKDVQYTNQIALTADDTNYFTLSLQDASGNVYASYSTKLTGGNGALVANTPAQLTLGGSGVTVLGDSTNPEVDVAAATALRLVVTKHGTGVPTLGVLQVEWYPL